MKNTMIDDAADVLKEFGTRKIESAEAALLQARAAVAQGAKQYAGVTDEFVRAHPWKVLGIAGAAGLLIGILLARR